MSIISHVIKVWRCNTGHCYTANGRFALCVAVYTPHALATTPTSTLDLPWSEYLTLKQ